MKAEKKVFVNQVKEGQAVHDIFMVKDMSRAETRANKPYLMMTLMDRSGEIACRLWENADTFMSASEPGNLVLIKGQAQAYRGILQLKLDSIHAIDKKEVEIALFLQSTKMNTPEMAQKIGSLAASVKEPFLRKLLLKFFDENKFLQEFQKAPAAKLMHHAYLGGLLEHTLAVSELAVLLADFYPALDRDLLLSGALLHDIGKIREFSFDSFPFDYTDRGRLMGHLVIGAEMIQDMIATIPEFPEDLSTRLQHLVLSHHGRYEFGSPCLPMMSEAFVLNFLDDLDAKLNFVGRLEEQASEEGYQWTDFQRPLDRFLFVKGRPHQENHGPEDTDEQDTPESRADNTRQKNLF